MNTAPVSPEAATVAQARPKLRRILAPTDLSPSSEKAINYAVALARPQGAKITLLHVCKAQVQGTEFAYLPSDEKALEEAATDKLHSIALRRIAPDLLGDVMLRFGMPVDEILHVAEEMDADMIVVNTHGYTGFKHVLLGSVAERIVRHARCPVLVVHKDQET
ncbi:MAG TPA: universal stress protein [Chthoniobacteraceae bacterium]|jgi:nucleotide-binding universal stress UspA family protein|nr:universal stress protein [Chthoniobacteraceae bacterium]